MKSILSPMRTDDPLDGIKDAWMEWKNGPATEQE